MVHKPILITQGGKIIVTSHGRLKLQVTRSQRCTTKLNLPGSPINLLPHIGLHSSGLKLHHLLGWILIFKIIC